MISPMSVLLYSSETSYSEMDQEDQEREFFEKFEKLALESEPDGYKAFKKTLTDFIGRKSKKIKSNGKPLLQSQRDEDSQPFTPEQEFHGDPLSMQETRDPAWVYPQSSSPPRDPVPLPTSGNDTYRFSHETRGFAVLIINSEFDSQSKRENAGCDEYYMYKMFKELNFDVYVLRNLASKELLKEMKEIRDSVSAQSDCFACVISSHGMEGQIRTSIPGVPEPFIRTEHFTYTRDGVVRTNELLELFNDRNCRPLKGKPKMFFIQACRSRLDVQRPDEVDMGVEVHLVETTASTTSTGTPARFFTRGDLAPASPITTGDVVGNYDDYSGRRREEFRKNFTAATLDPLYKNYQVRGLSRQYPGYQQRGYQVHAQASLQRQEPARTGTYKLKPIEPEPKPDSEPIEVFQIPCYNDYLVMFSSAAGTIAWSDSGKGGWLMYCLYKVFHDVTYTDDDLLKTLTRVAGKMARDMETYCPSTPHYNKAKSAACVYHRLSKDIYLQPVSYL